MIRIYNPQIIRGALKVKQFTKGHPLFFMNTACVSAFCAAPERPVNFSVNFFAFFFTENFTCEQM